MRSSQKNTSCEEHDDKKASLLTRLPKESCNPVLRMGRDGTLLSMNRAAESIMRKWHTGLGVKLPRKFIERLNRCLQDEACIKDGMTFEVKDQRLVFFPVRINNADTLILYGQYADRWRKYGEQLNLLANVFENVVESIMITDAHGFIEQVNPAFTTITGYAPEEVIGKTPRILKSDKHPPEFYKWMWREIKQKGIWRDKIWNRRKNGEVYPALLSIAAIKNEHSRTVHFCSICHDITEKKYNEDKLWFEAHYDVLTGMPGKQIFYDRLERAFTRAEREGTTLAVLLVGMDRFGQINGRLGYQAGDRILQAAGKRLKGCATWNDTIARYSGDQFTMIISEGEDDAAYAKIRAKQIVKALSVPVRVKDHQVNVSASIGISIYPIDAKDMHSLLDNATQALLTAKRQGGKQYVWHNNHEL